jgi:hypothetical protein
LLVVSTAISIGAARVVAFPAITREGVAAPVSVEAFSKTKTELPPWLATYKRSAEASINKCCGDEICVAVIVPTGATFPLEVSALLKWRIPFGVAT